MNDETKANANQLQKLFSLQTLLMPVLGIEPVEVKATSATFKNVVSQMMIEVGEILNPLLLDTRPWKKAAQDAKLTQDASYLEAATRTELIDVLFYWLEAAILLGLTEQDVLEIYESKWIFNIRRIARTKGAVKHLLANPNIPRAIYEDELTQTAEGCKFLMEEFYQKNKVGAKEKAQTALLFFQGLQKENDDADLALEIEDAIASLTATADMDELETIKKLMGTIINYQESAFDGAFEDYTEDEKTFAKFLTALNLVDWHTFKSAVYGYSFLA